VVWYWQLVERFDECLGPMRGVVVSSTYKHITYFIEALVASDDAAEERSGGDGGRR